MYMRLLAALKPSPATGALTVVLGSQPTAQPGSCPASQDVLGQVEHSSCGVIPAFDHWSLPDRLLVRAHCQIELVKVWVLTLGRIYLVQQ
jgi:hypothetical protein